MDTPRRLIGAGIVFLDLGIKVETIDRTGMILARRHS
jgi:hypothetical protein